MVLIPTPAYLIDASSVLEERFGALVVLFARSKELFSNRQTGTSGGVDHGSRGTVADLSVSANGASHVGAFLGSRAGISQCYRNRALGFYIVGQIRRNHDKTYSVDTCRSEV